MGVCRKSHYSLQMREYGQYGRDSGAAPIEELAHAQTLQGRPHVGDTVQQ